MTVNTVNKCLIQAYKDGDVDWIVHQVNTQGVMGSGIALQIKQEYPKHFEKYVEYCTEHKDLLGNSFAEEGVVGVFGQEHYGVGQRHTNYAALLSGLETFFSYIIEENPDTNKIGIPYGIGCGLGGGDWTIMRTLLEDLQTMYPEVTITFYYL